MLALKKTCLIDYKEQVDKNLFRPGLDWPRYALKKNLDFAPCFHLRSLSQLLMHGID